MSKKKKEKKKEDKRGNVFGRRNDDETAEAQRARV